MCNECNFEEQFPSLKGKLVTHPEDCYEEDSPLLDCDFGMYEQDLQKNCLDKQKVKEVIKQFVKHQGLSEVMAHGLLIELGLEVKMEITKEDFERYEDVRVGGRTNMFMISNVCALSGLDKEKVKEIMHNYGELNKKYPDVRKN